MQTQNLEPKKKWPLWLKSASLAAVASLIIFFFALFAHIPGLGILTGDFITWLYLPEVLILVAYVFDEINEINALPGSTATALSLTAIAMAMKYFIIGAIIGFIIQKLKNRKTHV